MDISRFLNDLLHELSKLDFIDNIDKIIPQEVIEIMRP